MKKIDEITIIGPGLIGSSLGLALKSKKIVRKIVGIDKSNNNLKDALNNNSIDESRNIIDQRVSKSEFIFICTPVSSIDGIVTKLVPFVTKKNFITDTGSVKNIFKKSTIKNISTISNFIPGHPIAGTENSGAKNAYARLFENKWCILTPFDKKDKNVKKLSTLWKYIGMEIATMPVDEHDKIMSITSHLPHLIAFTIVNTAFKIDIKKKRELINFSAGGFKDFTRIGSSDPKMWTDIFISNNKYLINTLDDFINDLKNFKKLIKKNNLDEIFDLLKQTKNIRKSILKANKLKR
tara:strand:+ start:318 stop:1199 length:882 start_codon:yes stop_codon:yes gene_type:complete